MTEDKYILIKGDISGIQEYIFNVKSKGAAKSLHDNSKNIMKLEKKYADELRKKLNIPNNTKPYEGGGGFYFLLENVKEAEIKNELKSLQNEINDQLKELSIDIRLAYAKGDTFKNAWDNLTAENNKKRYNFYDGIDQTQFDKLFAEFTKHENSLSPIIQQEDVKPVQNQKWSRELFTYLTDRKIELSEGQRSIREQLEKNPLDITPIIDFDGYASLAKARTGTDFLGVLKMDVDGLGKEFGYCQNQTQFEKLSHFFNTFFGKKNIETLLNNMWIDNLTYHQNIYTVYTGGDDCFFIGAWDAILNFADFIHTEFEKQLKEKLGDHTKITISAGIVQLNAKTPVVQLGKIAEEALNKAKSRVGQQTAKNAVCLMNEVFSWDGFKKILEQAETLTLLLNKKKITRGLLEKIKKSSIGFEHLQDRIRMGKPLPFDRVYKLKYYLRGVKKDDMAEVENVFQPYIDALVNILTHQDITTSETYINPMRFPLAARIAEFKTRNKNTNTNE